MGFEVLLKGSNLIRLLQGLVVALEISFISVAISIVLGTILGVVMSLDNKVIKGISEYIWR